MSFVSTILKFFGNKSKRDMRELSPVVNNVSVFSHEIKLISNDELRKKTIFFKQKIQQSISVYDQKIHNIKKEIIAEKGLEGMQGMGILMKELKNLHPNADMSQASNYAKEFLS